MPRTWTLAATLTLGGTLTMDEGGWFALNERNTKLFFFANSGGQGCWQWDGSELVDLQSDFFVPNDYAITDIAYFKGRLYLSVRSIASPYHGYILRWTGGGWERVWSIVDHLNLEGVIGSSTSSFSQWLDSDDNYIITHASNANSSPESFLFKSGDGVNWVNQTIDNQYPPNVDGPNQFFIFGKAKGNGYGQLLALTQDTNYPIEFAGGRNWDYLQNSQSLDGAVGYAQGKLFITKITSAPTGRIEWSTDWGVTSTDANAPTYNTSTVFPIVRQIQPDLTMMCFRNNQQAYTWDASINEFVADGTIGAGTLVGFFGMNGTLYAISNDSGTVRIYSGGALNLFGQFYYGRNKLLFKSNMPIPGINTGGMAMMQGDPVRVFVGSNAANGVIAAYASAKDDFATWTDITRNLDQTQPVKAFDTTPWGDSEAAQNGGEEEFADDKCN